MFTSNSQIFYNKSMCSSGAIIKQNKTSNLIVCVCVCVCVCVWFNGFGSFCSVLIYFNKLLNIQ